MEGTDAAIARAGDLAFTQWVTDVAPEAGESRNRHRDSSDATAADAANARLTPIADA